MSFEDERYISRRVDRIKHLEEKVVELEKDLKEAIDLLDAFDRSAYLEEWGLHSRKVSECIAKYKEKRK